MPIRHDIAEFAQGLAELELLVEWHDEVVVADPLAERAQLTAV